jgi:hypothetical protein
MRAFINERAANAEASPFQHHVNFAALLDLRKLILEQTNHVGRIAGRCDRDHRACFRN